MAVGWFEGVLVDAEGCDLLAAAGVREALVAFAGREGVSEPYRVQARQLLAQFDRGAQAFVVARAQGQDERQGASSAREVSRDEAAVMLDRSAQRVSQMVDEGRLEGRRVNGRLLIDGASLDREIARRRSAA